jgi:TatA/E family protein of Tat protein translocase
VTDASQQPAGSGAAPVPARLRFAVSPYHQGMGSFSISEILTILVVILVIFGPNRLPEFARKTGRLIAQARQALASFTAEFENDYGEAVNPIRDLSDELGGIKQDLTRTVTNLGAAVSADGSAGEEGAVDSDAESEDAEPEIATPIAAVPDASADADHRIEPVTIEDLIADATAGSPDDDAGENQVDGVTSGAESATPSADDQEGEVA